MKYSILSLILTLLFLGHGDLLAANDFRERIYVQTDKQVYLAGELLWLKLCVTDATGIPVSFSKVGYVELLDESTALVQAKIEIKEGIGGRMAGTALPFAYRLLSLGGLYLLYAE